MLRKGKPLTLQPDLVNTSVGKWISNAQLLKTAASLRPFFSYLKGGG